MFCQLVPSSRYCLFQHIIVVRTIVFTNLKCKSYQNYFVWYLMTRQIDMQSIRSTPDYVHPTMYTRLCTSDYVHPTMYTRLCTPGYLHPIIYTRLYELHTVCCVYDMKSMIMSLIVHNSAFIMHELF